MIKAQTAKGTEHGIGRTVVHVEEHGVAVRVPGHPLEHDQVPDARKAAEPVEQQPGAAWLGHDADVQHQLRGVVLAGAAWAGVAASGVSPDGAASAGADGAILAAAT